MRTYKDGMIFGKENDWEIVCGECELLFDKRFHVNVPDAGSIAFKEVAYGVDPLNCRVVYKISGTAHWICPNCGYVNTSNIDEEITKIDIAQLLIKKQKDNAKGDY